MIVIYLFKDFTEIRCAVVGNVDAGKSTLLGVLTHGELDNGRGLARQRLFRHKHEAGMQNLKLKFSKTKAKNCLVESNKSIARYFSFF